MKLNSLKLKIASLLSPKTVMHLQAIDHYMNGEHEIRLLKNLVDREKRAIDAGANIGTYSYFLRKYANEVYAYEPNPGLANRITQLLPDVKVRQLALSDKPGKLVLQVPLNEAGRPMHELGSVAQEFDGEVSRHHVDCVTLDSQRIENVGFIKIDVEQHEREVLRGAMKTIEKWRPVILAEVYPLKYAQALSVEFSFILEKNYVAWFFFAEKWLPMNRFDSRLHAAPENFGKKDKFMGNNLIFFPADHPRAIKGPTE